MGHSEHSQGRLVECKLHRITSRSLTPQCRDALVITDKDRLDSFRISAVHHRQKITNLLPIFIRVTYTSLRQASTKGVVSTHYSVPGFLGVDDEPKDRRRMQIKTRLRSTEALILVYSSKRCRRAHLHLIIFITPEKLVAFIPLLVARFLLQTTKSTVK